MGLLRRRWFQIFVSGLILLFLVERALVATSNPTGTAPVANGGQMQPNVACFLG